jgi:DNA-directed RNA polymerase specialized sigma24 family protein
MSDPDDNLLALEEGLRELACSDPVAAKVVELHHFAGLTQELSAEVLGLTVYQVRQKWTFARAWLKAVLANP